MSSSVSVERIVGPMSPADAERIAEMHEARLPGRMLTSMGRDYLRAFYRFVASSPLEKMFVAREDGRIVGVCAVTLAEETVLRRAIAATPFRFTATALARFCVSAPFRRDCFAVFAAEERPALDPQILVIFTDRTGAGVGARLVATVAGALADGEVLYTKTEADSAGAIEFYTRNGFEIFRHADYAGRRYVYLRRCRAL